MPDGPDLRVSDEQRDRAAAEIREHFAAGRLTDDELSDRIQAVYSARTEQELNKLLADLPKLPASPAQQKAELAARRSMLQRRLLQEAGGGSGAFLICMVIWIGSGASGFFWPIFVALSVLVPLVRNGWLLYGPDPDLERDRARPRRAPAQEPDAKPDPQRGPRPRRPALRAARRGFLARRGSTPASDAGRAPARSRT